jgi:hypothetical protein
MYYTLQKTLSQHEEGSKNKDKSNVLKQMYLD